MLFLLTKNHIDKRNYVGNVNVAVFDLLPKHFSYESLCIVRHEECNFTDASIHARKWIYDFELRWRAVHTDVFVIVVPRLSLSWAWCVFPHCELAAVCAACLWHSSVLRVRAI